VIRVVQNGAKVVFGLTYFRFFYSLKEEVRPNSFLKKSLISKVAYVIQIQIVRKELLNKLLN